MINMIREDVKQHHQRCCVFLRLLLSPKSSGTSVLPPLSTAGSVVHLHLWHQLNLKSGHALVLQLQINDRYILYQYLCSNVDINISSKMLLTKHEIKKTNHAEVKGLPPALSGLVQYSQTHLPEAAAPSVSL